MAKFTVHVRRTWEERFALEVEADNAEAASDTALTEEHEGAHEFNWNNVEQSDATVFAIDDTAGLEVFNIDEGYHEARKL